jgi:hypothetical protein
MDDANRLALVQYRLETARRFLAEITLHLKEK